MDESTLRNYFRKAIGVAPGASRKELKACRDRRAQRWRAMLTAPAGENTATAAAAEGDGELAQTAKLAEDRLSNTNTAYDCLTNADKFREFQSKLNAGEVHLPDLDDLLAATGEEVKPVAPRVLAKRQAQLHEKMERTRTLVIESVQKAGHDQALKLTSGKLPDADKFYDGVYSAAYAAGKATYTEEIAALAQTKLELDETFQSDLDELAVDQAEIIAHKEYDRLEDRAAMSAPTPAMPRFVALTLTVIIMGLVVSVCFYGVNSPTSTTPATTYPAATNTAGDATAQTAVVPAPANGTGVPGIANSVFNRSTFGDPSTPTAATPASNPADTAPAAAPVPVTTPAAPAATQAQPNLQPPAVSVDEAKAAELSAVAPGATPDGKVAIAAGLVANAGNAGLAGHPARDTKPGAITYKNGVDAAMKGAFADSLAGFKQAYTEGHMGEALYNQGVVLGAQGRYAEALVVYNQFLTDHAATPQALYNRALTHQLLANIAWTSKNTGLWRKHLTQALANYDLAIKADPRLSQGYFNRGIVHYELGQMDGAYDDFSRADSLLPKFMPAAGYNRDVVGVALKKGNNRPAQPAPSCPLGPVGPAGPP